MKSTFLSLFLLLSVVSWAQIPTYYQNLNLNLNGENLKNELSNLIVRTHENELSYTPQVWETLKNADLDPNQPGKVLLIYGWNDTDDIKNNDRTRSKTATCHTTNCENKWVREHVFPRSKGNPNLGFEGAGSDAHHLRAVDYDRNSLRSNLKFTANIPFSNSYSKVVADNYFFPGDEWKGDVARMIMYMYVRYGAQCRPVTVAEGSTSFSPLADMPNILLQWNTEDPVSAHEIARNNAIYSAQGNRNPFIDNPFLATKIWGGPVAQNTWNILENSVFSNIVVSVYPNPATESISISGLDDLSNYQIVLFDINGRKVIEENNTSHLNIAFLEKGVYFLQIEANNQNYTQKIIKH